MVKRCQWGTCNSDSRYPERVDNVKFYCFPRPRRNLARCKQWIKACGRHHTDLNLERINGNYNLFVCSKHFTENGPTELHPNPIPSDPLSTVTSTGPLKIQKVLATDFAGSENVCPITTAKYEEEKNLHSNYSGKKRPLKMDNDDGSLSLKHKLDILCLRNAGYTVNEIANYVSLPQHIVSITVKLKVKILKEYKQLPVEEVNTYLAAGCTFGNVADASDTGDASDVPDSGINDEDESTPTPKENPGENKIAAALSEWYAKSRSFNHPVYLSTVKKKVEELAEIYGQTSFVACDHWLRDWMESNAVILEEDIAKKLVSSTPRCQLGREFALYGTYDIYVVSEMGLCYSALFKDMRNTIMGDLDHLSLLLACDSTGLDKLPLLVVSNKEVTERNSLPCEYVYDVNGWITMETFVNWVMKLDKEMKKQHRHILLVLDDCPVHPPDLQEDLSNIKLSFIDKNSIFSHSVKIAILGILKYHYRKELLSAAGRHFASSDSPFLWDIQQACHTLMSSWDAFKASDIVKVFDVIERNMSAPTPCGKTNLPCLNVLESNEYLDFDINLEWHGMMSDLQICCKTNHPKTS